MISQKWKSLRKIANPCCFTVASLKRMEFTAGVLEWLFLSYVVTVCRITVVLKAPGTQALIKSLAAEVAGGACRRREERPELVVRRN